VWRTSYGFTEPEGGYVGPFASPAVSGEDVYSFDKWARLYCYNKSTGAVRWHKRVDMGPPYSWGYGGSPLVEGNLVILAASGQRAAVERDGIHDIAWPAVPGGVAGFPSPVPYSIGTNRFVALATGEGVFGVHAAGGEIAWSYPLPGKNERCQDPIVYGDTLLFTGYGFHWVRLRPSVDSVEVVWTNRLLRSGDSGSGVLIGDHVYTPTSNDGLLCFDARDGTQKWWHYMGYACQDGPLIGADGKLIVYWSGKLHVVNATPDGYDEGGREPFLVEGWQSCGGVEYAHSTPVLCNGKIYVRQRELLACYQVGPDPPTDTNSNAIADSWEAKHFPTPPCVAEEDPDEDGASNLDEYIAGTDPNDEDSSLRLSISNANTSVVVSAAMIQPRGPGYEYRTRYYSMQQCPGLGNGSWEGVPGCTNRLGNDSLLCVTNSEPGPRGFYRARARLE